MSDFQTFFKLGFQHITDINGYDHILFVVALCAIFRLKDLKKVAILITAFTIGHSLTLALATLQIITYSTAFIEFLIPVSIVFTCFINLFHKSSERASQAEHSSVLRYPMAMLFGLIHGMGFSNYLRSLLGKEESIWQPLLSFNIGLEIGQLLIVLLSLLLSSLLLDIFKVKKHDWNLILSSLVAGIAITLILGTDFLKA